MKKLQLLAISGSLRKASYNLTSLQALKLISANYIDINIVSLENLPLFNPDKEGDNIAAVLALKDNIKQSDGLIIASPEYAHGISGVLKNALDWLVSGEEFINLPIMLINTSPRASHAQLMLREVLVTMSANIIEKATLTIPLLGSNKEKQDIIADPTLSSQLDAALQHFKFAIAHR